MEGDIKELMTKFLLFLTFITCCSCADKEDLSGPKSKPGYILLAPRVLNKNAMNTIRFQLFNVDAPGKLTIALYDQYNSNNALAQHVEDIKKGTKDTKIKFYVGDIKPYSARFVINGTFNVKGGYTISGSDTVTFHNEVTRFIYVQTDKHTYKAGQKVMFRILLVDTKLRPIASKADGDIWIENPKRARIEQWKNVSFSSGIVQRELPLPDEPQLGSWNIYVNINGQQESQDFVVAEYVLPKYEVTITPPPYTLVTTEIVQFKACAKYTYGKDVEGTLKMNISIQSPRWYPYYGDDRFWPGPTGNEKRPLLQEQFDINGCYPYKLNASMIDTDFSGNDIEIVAQVIERGTGVIQNTTTTISRTRQPLTAAFSSDQQNYLKPGLPYYGKLQVKNPDGSPAANEAFTLCIALSRQRTIKGWSASRKVEKCKNYTSDNKGVIAFTVGPQYADTVSITLNAKSVKYQGNLNPPYPALSSVEASSTLTSWYSPSSSFMQIQPMEEPLPCGTKVQINILYTAKDKLDKRFYYQIFSQGQVVENNYVDVQFNDRNDISNRDWNDIERNATLSPDNPTTADKKDEEACPPLKQTRYRPRIGSVNIAISNVEKYGTSFYFLVYYIRDDKEVVSDSTKFDVQKCLPNKVDMKFSKDLQKPGTETSLFLSASANSFCGIKVIDKSVNLLDGTNSFNQDRVFGDLNGLEYGTYYAQTHCIDQGQPGLPPTNKTGYPSSSYQDAFTAFETSGCVTISDLKLITRPCQSNNYDPSWNYRPPIFYAGAHGSRGGGGGRAPMVESMEDVGSAERTRVEASFESLETDSAVKIRQDFPDTWLFRIESVGKSGQLKLKETLPDTVTEWVGSAVCINQVDGLGFSPDAAIKGFQDFFLSFTLPYSIVRGEKLSVIVTVFNYLDECLPIHVNLTQSNMFKLLSKSAETDLCVCGGHSETYTYYIQPTAIGTLNLTVTGKSTKSSKVCGSSKIANSDAMDGLTNSVIVEPEGFQFENVTSYFFFPQESAKKTFSQDIKFLLPNDVVSDSQRGFISATGDLLGPALQNMQNLLQLPIGCGEQNVIKFAPNVYLLNYLNATGELTDKIREEGLTNIRNGYQAELNFRRDDFSFSTFGFRDETGSIYLTAFVVRCFSEASAYIEIDNLNRSMEWIVSNQKANGCFPVIGQIFTEALQGSDQGNSTAALTAYILMSLLSAGYSSDEVEKRAWSCIDNAENITLWQEALFAYTAALSNDKKKVEKYLKELYSKSQETGDETYWPYKYLSVQLEIASYAVLTNLELGKPLEDSIPIIRWMNSKRNAQGGFVSTQDTVLGLKALTEFARLASKEKVNIQISTTGDLTQNVSITEDNKLVVRTYKISSVPGTVKVKATGTGGGLIQGIVRCNTNTPYKKQQFKFDVHALRNVNGCDHFNVSVCTSYSIPNKSTNMALVEIKMFSGTSPVKDSLDALLIDKSLDLKHFDVANNKVFFYFDELTHAVKCFNFTVEQVFEVDDLKPATAKVYDYYAIERTEESLYTLGKCKTGSSTGSPGGSKKPTAVHIYNTTPKF